MYNYLFYFAHLVRGLNVIRIINVSSIVEPDNRINSKNVNKITRQILEYILFGKGVCFVRFANMLSNVKLNTVLKIQSDNIINFWAKWHRETKLNN